MLFLYLNELNVYEVIDDKNGNETILYTSNDLKSADDYFDNYVASQRKSAIKSWDGAKIREFGNTEISPT